MVIFVSSSSYGWAQIYQYIIESYHKLMHLHLKSNRYYHLRITLDLIHGVTSKCGFLRYFKSPFEYSWVLVTSLCYVHLYRHQPILHDSLNSLLTPTKYERLRSLNILLHQGAMLISININSIFWKLNMQKKHNNKQLRNWWFSNP